MLLRRWCLAVLFCASVSVAWGQQRPLGIVEVTPAAPNRTEDPFAGAPSTLAPVVIEVTIAQWRTKPGKEGEARTAPALDGIDLPALEKSGELRVKERIRLTTLDQQKAFFQRGESVPIVTGVSATARGGGGSFGPQRSINYQQIGTMVIVTPRIAKDRIIVEAKIDRSSVESGDGPLLAKGEDGTETRAPNLMTGTTQTTVTLEAGKTVVVGGITRQGKDTSDGEVILISADVLK